MVRNYSRLASVEEKKNIKRAVLFGILALFIIVFLVMWGFTSLVKLTSLVTGLKKGQNFATKKDNIPPPPPQINDLQKYTNQARIIVSGASEPGAKVKINLNSNEEEVDVDPDGKFSDQLSLNKGDNFIFLYAVDKAGNKSQQTPQIKVVFDITPPDLNINSPSDGSTFYGATQQKITIKGTTKSGANIIINDRLITVDDSGNFSFDTSLHEGDNSYTIKSTDLAGNITEKTVKYTFSP